MMMFLEAQQPCPRWPKSFEMCALLQLTDISKQGASALGGDGSLSPLMRATSDTKERQAASTIIQILMQIITELILFKEE